jgi:hypothetical protein
VMVDDPGTPRSLAGLAAMLGAGWCSWWQAGGMSAAFWVALMAGGRCQLQHLMYVAAQVHPLRGQQQQGACVSSWQGALASLLRHAGRQTV